MKLKYGQRYLAYDRNRKPTFFFTPMNRRDIRLFTKMQREGTISVTPVNPPF